MKVSERECIFLCFWAYCMCIFVCICVCLCVCFSKRLNCFPIWLSRASEGQKTSYHKVIDATLYSYFYSLWVMASASKPLSPPTTTTFLLPPARPNFRNLQNLQPIDFPPEFTLLLKIQRIKKGDILNTNVDTYTYYHTVVPSNWNMATKFTLTVHIYVHTPTHTLVKL